MGPNGAEEGSQAEAIAALTARVANLEAQIQALLRLQQADTAPRVAPILRSSTEPPPSSQPSTLPPPAPVFTRFSENTSGSLESDIGAKVLSKIAVLLLLAGAAWFLKWAFDNRWIGASGRVIVGLVCGAAIIVWSERFRRSGTPAFAYALKAVGTGVLYLSLWASFQLYHLVPAPVALAAMIAVTAWNAVLAVVQDSRLLAGYAIFGAYLTPVLLSSGGNHELFLFLYLASIAVAVAVLLRAKPWTILLAGPVPCTAAFFIVWYGQFYTNAQFTQTGLLALLLWSILAAIPLLAHERESVLAGVLQPLAAAAFGALTMYSVLADSGRRGWESWIALAFAAAYLAASRLRRRSLLSAIHLSLAISFITIAIPLKLTGHGITDGWLAEALVVLFIAATVELEPRARAALQWLGIAAILLGVAGALVGPMIFYAGQTPFANRAFAGEAGACVVLIVAMVLFRRMASAHRNCRPNGLRVAGWFFLLLNVMLLIALYRETVLALGYGEQTDFAYSGWMALQGAIMLAAGFWKRAPLARWTALLLFAATIIKMVAYDMRHLGTGYRVVSYLALGILLLGASFAYQKDWIGLHAASVDESGPQS